jgi:hypothetical protein
MRNHRIHQDVEVYRRLSVLPSLVVIKDQNGWSEEQIEEWSHKIALATFKHEHSDSRSFWRTAEAVIGRFDHP